MICHAANFEDVILGRLFREQPTGPYVDAGAYNPCVASNTCFYYEGGWPESFHASSSSAPSKIRHRPSCQLRVSAATRSQPPGNRRVEPRRGSRGG
jgi:hypothetical protein